MNGNGNGNGNGNAQQSGSFGLLIAILISIALGFAIGGYAPAVGKELGILGDIFLNALKMIVVPLVMISILVGVTSLGDVRKLGGIGGRTIAFYLATTGLSVVLGLIIVNIIKPGENIKPGEIHEAAEYRIEDGYTVQLIGGDEWDRKNVEEYIEKYTIKLLNTQYVGEIAKIDSSQATVKSWKKMDADGYAVGTYVASEDGKDLLYNPEDDSLTEVMPEFSSGTGVEIALPIADKVADKRERGIVSTLKDVVLGMVPTNIFKSMAEMDVLPLIVFSIFLGAVLTVLGEAGKPVIEFMQGMNAAIMKMVHWLMYFAPIGIMGLLAGRIGKEGGFTEFLQSYKRSASTLEPLSSVSPSTASSRCPSSCGCSAGATRGHTSSEWGRRS